MGCFSEAVNADA